jgi:hypothetical protein
VAVSPPLFLAELSEQDRAHFRNLALIRPQLPSESQLSLVESLARTLGCRRLLTVIARTPHWLVHGPILEALAENEATPEPIRRDLEMAVSLVDLMREMDRAPAGEKDERAEMAKAVYAQLPAAMKPVVKQQLKALARQVQPSGLTQEMPPLPAEEQDWDALSLPPEDTEAPVARLLPSREERLAQAAATHVAEELQEALLSADPELRLAALRNPVLGEELLSSILRQAKLPECFEDAYGEARWYFRDAIRAAIGEAPCAPPAMARRIRIATDLVACLDAGCHGPGDLQRIAGLFTQLEEAEYQFVTFWAKRNAPHLLRVVKVFYDRMLRRQATQATGLGVHPAEGRWASLEERVFLANQATQPDQLIAALKDPDPQVFRVVLENPGLTPRELVAAIPVLDQARAERLAAHALWGAQPAVQEALLHNPNLGEAAALRLLPALGTLRALLDLLRDPRMPHVRVKQQALERLRASYLALGPEQRVVALRGSGGEIIRHLPQETLRDEAALAQLVSDRQLDPSILLRLARHKQTPRGILERIAGHPTLMAHPPIMSELLLNPKTPRESAIRIWGLLSESEQQQLLRSPHLPSTLRTLAS